jgi:hypothetical protein
MSYVSSVSLQRTNAQDIPNTSFANPESFSSSTTKSKQTAGIPAALALLDEGRKGKKKQTANVRNLLMYKKTLAEYLDELVSLVLLVTIESIQG